MGEAFRYILRQIAIMMLSIAVALTLAVWLSQCLRYLGVIVSHGLPMGLSFKFLALMLPSLLILILPVSMFIAVAFVYQKLMLDRELVVLRACGVSQLALSRPALALAVIVTAACYALSLYFIPLSAQSFIDFKHKFLGSFGQFLVQEGVFSAAGPGVTIYVRQRDDDGSLRGILIDDARDPRNPISYTAAFGTLQSTESGLRLTMRNGTFQQRDPAADTLSILNFDDAAIDVAIDSEARGERRRMPEELYLHELLNPDAEIVQTVPVATLRAVAHTNLAMPLYALGFTAIGLAFILGGGLQRRDRTLRIFLAIVTVGLLEVIAVSLRNLAGKNPSLLPLMYVGPLLPTLAALVAMAYADGRPRLRVPRHRQTVRFLEQPQPG